jgi:hypothetical protein
VPCISKTFDGWGWDWDIPVAYGIEILQILRRFRLGRYWFNITIPKHRIHRKSYWTLKWMVYTTCQGISHPLFWCNALKNLHFLLAEHFGPRGSLHEQVNGGQLIGCHRGRTFSYAKSCDRVNPGMFPLVEFAYWKHWALPKIMLNTASIGADAIFSLAMVRLVHPNPWLSFYQGYWC